MKQDGASGRQGPRPWCSTALPFVWCAALSSIGCGDDGDSGRAESRTLSLAPMEQENVEVATTVIREGLIGGNTDIINRYVREDYIQHNIQAMDGRAGLLAFISSLQTQPDNQVEIHRTLADDDYVALHSTYGSGAARQVAFDIFRLVDGQLAEHWDALTPWVDSRASLNGNTLVDGMREVTDRDKTEENRDLVREFVDVVFKQGRIDRLPEYIGDSYVQHDPNAEDGLAGLRAFFASTEQSGLALGIEDSQLVVADGNFVFVGSEGFYGPRDERPYAVFYDLYRVEEHKLVEHWDIIPSLPEDLASIPHENGLF
jgi:predicted SnoaL-like aldol condensation-catalyzing enzyme